MAAGAVAPSAFADKPKTLAADMPDTSGRKIRFVSIGTGIRGCDLLRAAAKVPNGECVGTADLYTMHQKAGVEAYGKDIPTVRDYRSLLDLKDVDAVIVATADFQHRRVVLDCVEAGKDVYCEKPMSHNVADGHAMVDAIQKHKRIFQAGSQRVSNPIFKKAAEIVKEGRLGQINLIEGYTDRNSDSGAWVYPIAPDASPETIDWKTWLRDAPDRPFDEARFFRWRCFADYGEGLAGDLYVHLLSGIQCATGINAAPNRAFSMGSLTHFKDGRDFPDLIATLYDYNGVTVNLHCNQNNDAPGEMTALYGKEGSLIIKGNTLTFTPQDTHPQPEWYSLNGWTADLKKKYYDEWWAAHPQKYDAPLTETYTIPQGFDDSVAHIANFFRAVETREHVLEDEIFGNNTAIACHMANHSYFNHAAAVWDPASKTIKS
ncbi:Gfo/Idh/MocA family protein [Occallatibacter riparius]|uniref:Gfo/Idh/MocA family oxidoreductase n=1 Tax=Occallatibacter riparius TaxID=1002689 RepID=A0A9J7BW05_9BACT|nr:Gfo/Idh/MocA family oxidoreductase [Occallatibacter riparius]UWZ85070.1 Gfo/Idh/MocA family oxidoreductase [Occallatibacter riparius]